MATKPSGIILPGYGPDTVEAARRAAVVKALREGESIPTKGEMVGNQYVAPHWTQQLGAALDNVMGAYSAGRGVEAEAAAKQKEAQAAQEYLNQRPTAQEVPVQTTGVVAPEFEGQNVATQTKEPTQQEMMNYYQQGMLQHPSLQGILAPEYAEQLKAPERAEQRQFKAEEAEKERVSKNELARAAAKDRIQQIDMQLKDKSLNREMIVALANEKNALTDHIAHLVNELGYARVSATKEAAEARRAAAQQKVPENILKVMRGAEQMAENMDTTTKSFDPKFAGVKGAIKSAAGEWGLPGGSTDAANWWKDYENQAALVERHEKFGTALSAGEQAAWRKATISPGMSADVIKHNLEIRQKLANKMYSRARNTYTKTGYPAVGEAFGARDEGGEEDESSVAEMNKKERAAAAAAATASVPSTPAGAAAVAPRALPNAGRGRTESNMKPTSGRRRWNPATQQFESM